MTEPTRQELRSAIAYVCDALSKGVPNDQTSDAEWQRLEIQVSKVLAVSNLLSLNVVQNMSALMRDAVLNFTNPGDMGGTLPYNPPPRLRNISENVQRQINSLAKLKPRSRLASCTLSEAIHRYKVTKSKFEDTNSRSWKLDMVDMAYADLVAYYVTQKKRDVTWLEGFYHVLNIERSRLASKSNKAKKQGRPALKKHKSAVM